MLKKKNLLPRRGKEWYLFKGGIFMFGSAVLWQIPSYSTFKRKPLPKQYRKGIMTWEILKQMNS